MTPRIEVSASPQDLAELEEVCLVARQQGFPGEAYVDLSTPRRVVIKTDSEQVSS